MTVLAVILGFFYAAIVGSTRGINSQVCMYQAWVNIRYGGEQLTCTMHTHHMSGQMKVLLGVSVVSEPESEVESRE